MGKLKKWLRKAFDQVIDPERDERIELLVSRFNHGLRTERQSFRASRSLAGLEFTENDLRLAKQKVFRGILQRGWQDGVLSNQQQAVARWVATSLELSPHDAEAINLEFAKFHFATALASAMEDGELDPLEVDWLSQIAIAGGSDLPTFVRQFFLIEGEKFLRGVFLNCVSDGDLSQDEWRNLISVAEQLGVTREELLRTIQPQACQFVEHVLADAKSDGRLSDTEKHTLYWLLNILKLPAEVHNYVLTQVDTLEMLTAIQEGKIPSIPAPQGIAIKAGEIVHLSVPATLQTTRQLKSGPRVDAYDGVLTLTDNRIIFSSDLKSQNISFRRIVSYCGGINWIDAQIAGKPAFTFSLHNPSDIAYPIFQTAIELANQRLTQKKQGKPSRHIPRDVRQRVWQRYGGKCADCSAVDYLEFDHIIPVAKGGSNADANIQLLCRRCNSKKSDHI